MRHRFFFVLKKLLRMALLLLGVSIVTFTLMCASPLDPLATNVGQVALGSMSPEQVEKLEAYWGVNTPPVERYLGWRRGRFYDPVPTGQQTPDIQIQIQETLIPSDHEKTQQT